MNEGYKELLKLAKVNSVETYEELIDLVYLCKSAITGADVECVRKKLKISMF